MSRYENEMVEMKDGRYLVKHNVERINRLKNFVHECASGSHFYCTKGDFLTACVYLAIESAIEANISEDSLLKAVSGCWEQVHEGLEKKEKQ